MILDVLMGTLPCPDKYIIEDEILPHLSIQLTLHAKDKISACWIGWSTHWHTLLGSPLLILCGVGHSWRTDHFPFQIIVECEIHCWWTCQNPTNLRIWSSYLYSQWSWALNEVFITSATTRANALGRDNLQELLLSRKLFLNQIHLSMPDEHGPSALPFTPFQMHQTVRNQEISDSNMRCTMDTVWTVCKTQCSILYSYQSVLAWRDIGAVSMFLRIWVS